MIDESSEVTRKIVGFIPRTKPEVASAIIRKALEVALEKAPIIGDDIEDAIRNLLRDVRIAGVAA